MAMKYWYSLSSRGRRILTFLAFFLAALVVSVAGALTPLTDEEANTLNQSFQNTSGVIDSLPLTSKATYILGNNLFICLVAFIPLFGIFFELLVLYDTGLVVAAQVHGLANSNPALTLLTLVILPFGLLEFISYSIGMNESVWLTWRIIHKHTRREIANAAKLVALVALFLLVAAFIEATLLELLA